MIREEIRRRTTDQAADGSVSVSFVYPTRDRPDFVREALAILEMQQGTDFEVIISDNYSDASFSCKQICRESALDNLVYVHPSSPLPKMAQSWEYPLREARGEYVAYLTDKMFVLPNALGRIGAAVAERPEIVTWVADIYRPDRYPDYFGGGRYETGEPGAGGLFTPQLELNRRGRSGRSAHSQPDYSRGKIAFGAYHRDLIKRCVDRFGGLFHRSSWGATGLSPDYTSLVLGLSEARSALEITDSCVVQVYTDISGGMLIDTKDSVARATLDESLWPALPIPGLYASQHNIVANDYVALRKKFDLTFDFDMDVWVGFCVADIYRPSRMWSSPEVESQQKGILEQYMQQKD